MKSLLAFLDDGELEVKFEALRSLDTLLGSEGLEVCTVLYKKQILKRLENSLNEVSPVIWPLIEGLFSVSDGRNEGR